MIPSDNPIAKAAGELAAARWTNKDLNWKQFDVQLPRQERSAEYVNNISWNLWRNMEKQEENGLMAPFLIILPLANLCLGATGETVNQLRNLLGFTGDEEEDTKLHKWFLYVYMRLTQQTKRSRVAPLNVLLMKAFPIENVDPEIRDCYMRYSREVQCMTLVETLKNYEPELNRRTKKKSYSKLLTVCPINYFDEDSTMGMVSSLYFAGQWMNLPNDGYASIENFYVSANQMKQCPYIRSQTRADYYEYDDCTVCGFEFKWSSITMYFILPKDRFGLVEFEKKLSADKLMHIIRFTARRRVYKQFLINVQIPKFTLVRAQDMTYAVRKLPIPDLFDKSLMSLGNFSFDLSPRSLEHVYQTVGIETQMKSGNLQILVKEPKKFIPGLPDTKYFTVESPFMFVLFEHCSEIIMYIGRVHDPTL